jgi:hypothetical protein
MGGLNQEVILPEVVVIPPLCHIHIDIRRFPGRVDHQ